MFRRSIYRFISSHHSGRCWATADIIGLRDGRHSLEFIAASKRRFLGCADGFADNLPSAESGRQYRRGTMRAASIFRLGCFHCHRRFMIANVALADYGHAGGADNDFGDRSPPPVRVDHGQAADANVDSLRYARPADGTAQRLIHLCLSSRHAILDFHSTRRRFAKAFFLMPVLLCLAMA